MINKAILVGRLGADPEVKNTSNNKLATLSVATSEKFKDKSGEMQEKTEWHRVVFWGNHAQVCENYLKKGSFVYIEGKIETQSYEKDGEKKYNTQVVGKYLQMLSGKE